MAPVGPFQITTAGGRRGPLAMPAIVRLVAEGTLPRQAEVLDLGLGRSVTAAEIVQAAGGSGDETQAGDMPAVAVAPVAATTPAKRKPLSSGNHPARPHGHRPARRRQRGLSHLWPLLILGLFALGGLVLLFSRR